MLLLKWMIVYVFSDQYLGLTSLFSSILQVLSVAELGFSSAIIYNLYKTLANNDICKVRAIMAFYKRVYRIVGTIIAIIGVCLMPLLPYLIKDEVPKEINIYYLYALFLINTCAGYFFFAYKVTLLDALQRLDLAKKAYSIVNFCKCCLQVVSLYYIKNYYLFIALNILGTSLNNIFAALICQKKYPQYYCEGTIDTETHKDIISRVKGLVICNVSSVTYTSFDSIILSSFIGLSTVAIYNNYLTICNIITKIIVVIRSSMQASVGNSIATESKEKNYQDMLFLQFSFSVIATWCVSCLLSLFQPFMTWWMGKDRLLGEIDIVLLCMWFFISVTEHAFFVYLSGNGLWWEMKLPYIFSSICNIILNIVLGFYFGVSGIIFSTMIVTLIFGFFWQSAILFKHYFLVKPLYYYLRQAVYFLVCIVVCSLSYFINSIIPYDESLLSLFFRAGICTLVSITVMFLCYFKTKSFQMAKHYFLAIKK